MYLHLGGNVIVREDDVVGVFDLDNSSQSKITRGFLSAAERAGTVSAAGDDIPKSFVVCRSSGRSRVIISQMAPSTLLKRSGESLL